MFSANTHKLAILWHRKSGTKHPGFSWTCPIDKIPVSEGIKNPLVNLTSSIGRVLNDNIK